MRFVEANEIEAWCADHAVGLTGNGSLLDEPKLANRKRAPYAQGGRSGLEAAIAATCVEALGHWKECLLWVHGWGIWPSSEDWPAYYALRGAQGELRSLERAPGHLFVTGESELLLSFLTHVLQNAWDADIVSTTQSDRQAKRIHVSHDEWVEIQSTEPTKA